MSTALIAFRAYTAILFQARALWIILAISVLFVGGVGIAFLMGRMSNFLTTDALEGMRQVAVLPGVPVAAIVMSEMSIRDGINHRTLLYHILAPVPRPTLLIVRTLVTAGVLAMIMGGCVLVVHGFEGTVEDLPGELLAVILGGAAYTSLFGLLHLVTRRGLIAALGLTFIIDVPLGTFPFGLRNFAPSYHVRVLSDQIIQMDLPVQIATSEPNVVFSTAMLVLITAGALTLSAMRFSRMNLGEMC